MGGGGKTPKATTTTTALPTWMQPYQRQILEQGAQVASRPFQQFPRSAIAGFTPAEQWAQGAGMSRAVGGSPLIRGGQGLLGQTLGGGFLDVTANPMFQQAAQDITQQYQTAIAPQTQAAFARAGAFGGSAQAEQEAMNRQALARGLGAAASDVYGQERGRQMQALGMAPTYAEQDWADIARATAIGEQQREMSQARLSEDYQRWLEAQNYPLQQLGILSESLGAAAGGTGSVTQRGGATAQGPGKAAGALGGAATGAMLGTQIMPGIGTAIGALLGGGLGYFGG